MTAKFISAVLKAATVATVPLAMLVASVPASAQRASQRSNVDQDVLAQIQRLGAAVIGVNPYESLRYGNSGVYQDGRYQDGHYKNGHYKNAHYKNGHYKNRHYKNGRDYNDRNDNGRDEDDRGDNGRYNDGRYGNGQYGQYGQYPAQRPVYDNRGAERKSLPVPQRGNGYPSRGDARNQSRVIPGFPSPNAPSGRAGKTLPGTSQRDQRNH